MKVFVRQDHDEILGIYSTKEKALDAAEAAVRSDVVQVSHSYYEGAGPIVRDGNIVTIYNVRHWSGKTISLERHLYDGISEHDLV